MKLKFSKLIVTIYLLLFIVSITYLFFMLQYYPEKAEFAGVYTVILTLPWSIIIFTLIDKVYVISALSLLMKMLFFCFCGILNTFILYMIGHKLQRKS